MTWGDHVRGPDQLIHVIHAHVGNQRLTYCEKRWKQSALKIVLHHLTCIPCALRGR